MQSTYFVNMNMWQILSKFDEVEEVKRQHYENIIFHYKWGKTFVNKLDD